MAKLKTQKTDDSVEAFLASIDDEGKRADSRALVEIMREITGEEPALWGPSIVGFGSYHYVYESGREGDSPLTGFSPRKTALTLYIMSGFSGEPELMAKLGKYKTGKSCLYVKRLEDIDLATLRELIERSVRATRERDAG